jgi:thioredoxin 1
MINSKIILGDYMVQNVNSNNFKDEVLNSDKTVVVDFYADWCGPCRMLSPVIEELSSEMKDVKFVKVDTDSESSIAGEYEVQGIPTIVFIKDGKEVERVVGFKDKDDLINILNKLK